MISGLKFRPERWHAIRYTHGMETQTNLDMSSPEHQTAEAYELSMNCLARALPEWGLSRHDEQIRMVRRLQFRNEQALRDFETRLGNMMKSQSLFVLARKVPGKANLLVSLRLKPTEASVIAAAEIGAFIDGEYLQIPASVHPVAA